MRILNFFIICIIFFTSSNAYAYLDPGTGSIILQAIVGGFAACLTYIILFWNKARKIFYNLFKKNKK